MPLFSLLSDFLDDLSRPGMPWQLGTIAACMLVGWLSLYVLRVWWRRSHGQNASPLRSRVDSIARVAAPLLVVGLLSVVKMLLLKHHFHVNIVKAAIPIFWSLAAIRAVFFLLRRVFARRGPLGQAFVPFERIFVLVAWLAVVLYITGMWPDIWAFLDSYTLSYGPKRNDHVSLADILQGVISVAVMVMLALWAGAAFEERLMGVQGLHSSLRVALARLGRAVLIVGAVLFSLNLVGIDLTVLSVFGGALGVGLGLGMQRIASNYVSGFIILLDRSLSIGDMISVDKYAGKVTRINTRYTVLQGLDGVESVLPNEMLVSGAVLNQSLSSRAVRGSTRVTLAYGTDLDMAMPLLAAQAAASPRVLAEPAPGVALSRFGPDGYELELGFWVNDPENGTGGVVADINKRIYALVATGAIKLGYPSIDSRVFDAHIASVVARITHPAGNSTATPP